MISLSTKVLFCALLFLFTSSYAKLTVKTPKTLREQFDKLNGIDYVVLTPQNGITYRRSFIGNLVLSDPADGCDHVSSIETVGNDAISNPVIVVDWGECHYAQKVKNAEIAGAKMVILVLRNDMPTNHPQIKNLPIETNVEVLAVSKRDGDILLSFLRDAENKGFNDPESIVEITYSYDVERHVNYQKGSTVVIDFWFAAADINKQAYSFMHDLGNILRDFGEDKLDFYPHYVLWQCDECAYKNFQSRDPQCVSGGRYCDPEPLSENRLSGSLAVIENLRQICFREQASKVWVDDEWWRYTTAFGEECVGQPLKDLDACRKHVYDSQSISETDVARIEKNMRDSFSGAQSAKLENSLDDNTYLKKELELKEEMHVDHYPAIYVNKERWTGSFNNLKGLEDFICQHFTELSVPAYCKTLTQVPKVQEPVTTTVDTAVYVGIIFASIVVMAIMLYCVRRSVKRQVMGRMNDEISHIVTQYKQFKDKSNSFSNEEDT